MIEEMEREGLQLMHLRTVPTNPEVLGVAAREVEPNSLAATSETTHCSLKVGTMSAISERSKP